MKYLNILVVLLVAAILFAGCSQQASQTSNPPQQPGVNTNTPSAPAAPATTPPAASPQNPVTNPATPSPSPLSSLPKALDADSSIGLSMAFFRYGEPKSYEYKTTTKLASSDLVGSYKLAITDDTVDGKSAWLMTMGIQSEGMTVTSKTWIDKTTEKCLKVSMSGVIMGKTQPETPGQCPAGNPSASDVPKSNITYAYVGKESVTVPAGTYNCDKYTSTVTSNGKEVTSTLWVSSDVLVPIKMETGGISTTELVSYS